MQKLLFSAALVELFISHADALTLKKGQVISADDGVYDGASPEQKEVYIKRANQGGDQAGLAGQNVFVVVDDDIAFVPITDLAGKTKDSQLNVIGDAIVAKITGTEQVSFSQLNELQRVSEESGIALEQILKVDNALGELDAELAEIITDEIEALVEQGALEEVQAFLESDVLVENLSTIAEVTRQVEAELGELASEIDYYNACLEKAGTATCDAIIDEFAEIGGE